MHLPDDRAVLADEGQEAMVDWFVQSELDQLGPRRLGAALRQALALDERARVHLCEGAVQVCVEVGEEAALQGRLLVLGRGRLLVEVGLGGSGEDFDLDLGLVLEGVAAEVDLAGVPGSHIVDLGHFVQLLPVRLPRGLAEGVVQLLLRQLVLRAALCLLLEVVLRVHWNYLNFNIIGSRHHV